jgi:hypothetical protein
MGGSVLFFLLPVGQLELPLLGLEKLCSGLALVYPETAPGEYDQGDDDADGEHAGRLYQRPWLSDPDVPLAAGIEEDEATVTDYSGDGWRTSIWIPSSPLRDAVTEVVESVNTDRRNRIERYARGDVHEWENAEYAPHPIPRSVDEIIERAFQLLAEPPTPVEELSVGAWEA